MKFLFLAMFSLILTQTHAQTRPEVVNVETKQYDAKPGSIEQSCAKALNWLAHVQNFDPDAKVDPDTPVAQAEHAKPFIHRFGIRDGILEVDENGSAIIYNKTGALTPGSANTCGFDPSRTMDFIVAKRIQELAKNQKWNAKKCFPDPEPHQPTWSGGRCFSDHFAHCKDIGSQTKAAYANVQAGK